MASVFEGVSSLICDVLGAPVTYLPQGAAARVIGSVFRLAPLEEVDPDGRAVLITSPTWSVPKSAVPDLAAGDQISPGNGRTYEICNFAPSGSPASDAMMICELREVWE